MKKFCESLTEDEMRIINFLENEVINKSVAAIIRKSKNLLYL